MDGEWAKFWLRGGVEHLYANYVTHAFTPHTHEGYVIAAVEGGVEGFRYHGAGHHATPGCLIFINPGEVHTGYAETAKGWRYRVLYPEVETVVDAVAAVYGVKRVPYFPQAVVYDPDLAARVWRYQQFSECEGDSARNEAFLELIACAVTRYADGSFRSGKVVKESGAVQQIRDYLEACMSANVPLADLADLTGLSTYAVLRTFRRQTGLTPHTYQVQRRVENAKKRLQNGEAIALVATETGFFDQSHLTKHFKRIVGVTPHAFVRGSTVQGSARAISS